MTLRLWACGLLLITALPLNAGEPLMMTVSAPMPAAPATVRVRLIIEPDSSNRALEVVADSADFYRSSRIELDASGRHGLSWWSTALFRAATMSSAEPSRMLWATRAPS